MMAKDSPNAALLRSSLLFALAIAMFWLVFGPLARLSSGQPKNAPVMKLKDLGIKFVGAPTCGGGGNCHEKSGDKAPPAEMGHEYSIWKSRDAHAEAFKTLKKKQSKEIADKLKIADAATSEKCLGCHATLVPENLRGEKFSLEQGNSCEACHGPGEKFLEPHKEKGWIEKQRATPHDAMLTQTGMFDTRPLNHRATMCTGCHLSIDADMVAAGHPQTKFELDSFSNPKKAFRHWPEREDFYGARQWLAGQAAELRDSAQQLADRKDDAAAKQAMAHAKVASAAADLLGLDASALGAMKGSPADAASHAADVVKTAEAALAKDFEKLAIDKAWTTKALNAIAADDTIADECGVFGMQQQAWAIRAMCRALGQSGGFADADATIKMIDDKMIGTKKAEVKPDDYKKALAELRGKLPK
jgi:hypothetical protein